MSAPEASKPAGNFLRTLPFALAFALVLLPQLRIDTPGLLAALASGALASGVGYAIWYTLLPGLRPTGELLSASWRATLPRGRYRLWVYATDQAGNRQATAGSARLVIR